MSRRRKRVPSSSKNPFPYGISAHYSYIRSLQLEGRYPLDVGVWPITAMRIGVGWGRIGNDAWPPPLDSFQGLRQEEPPGVTRHARQKGLSLRAWVPRGDADPRNFP